MTLRTIVNDLREAISKQWLVVWLIIGVIIRISISPLFSHLDLITLDQSALNLATNHTLILSDSAAIIYLLAGWLGLLLPVLPHYLVGLIVNSQGTSESTFIQSQPGIQILLLTTRIPYIFFDILSGLVIQKMFKGSGFEKKAFIIWMLNPVTIFVSYFFGQYDIIPTFFLILAIYLFKKDSYALSSLSLGVVAALKSFGFLFIPLIPIIAGRNKPANTKAKLWVVSTILGLIPILTSDLSVSLFKSAYVSANAANAGLFNGYYGTQMYNQGSVVGNSFLSALVFFALDYSVHVSTLESFVDVLYLFPIIYGIFILYCNYIGNAGFDGMIDDMVILLSAYYALNLFLPQWFVWFQPLLLYKSLKSGELYKIVFFASIPIFFIYTWFWDPNLTTLLFLPLTPSAAFWQGPVAIMNDHGWPAIQLVQAARSFLSGLLLFVSGFCIIKGWQFRQNVPPKESAIIG
jgi:hypothetical protein